MADIINADNNTIVSAADEINYITNYGSHVTINGGNSPDLILNSSGKFVLINAGAGTDAIQNLSGNFVTIDGGDDDDTIGNADEHATILGGNGDDSFFNAVLDYTHFNDVVFNGGAGNDTLNRADVIEYSGGNDVITELDERDLIRLTSGTISSASVNGTDLVLNIGDGSISIASAFSGAEFSATGKRTIFVMNSAGAISAYVFEQSGAFETTALASNVVSTGNNVITAVSNTVVSGSGVLRNYGDRVTINGATTVENLGSRVLIDGANAVYNIGSKITVKGTGGNDTIDLGNGGGNRVEFYSGAGNDTVFNLSATDVIKITDESTYTTATGGNDVIVAIGSSSLTIKDAADISLNISVGEDWITADAGTDDIIYDEKKPSVITVGDGFTGLVAAENFSTKITLIDASADTNPVELRAGSKSTVLKAGSGNSTLVGGSAADKLYGGDGIDVFVYELEHGADQIFGYEAQDVISLSGARLDEVSFKDVKGAVAVSFSGSSKSKLTINKKNADDAITFSVGDDTFSYGVLPTGVTFDDADKKTAIVIGSDADDDVTINAADITSTAKTIDGSGASGSVYLIGNTNKNVIQAGNYDSTLYGGHSTKAVNDTLIGGEGDDVFMYAVGDGKDVVVGFDNANDIILVVGTDSLTDENFLEKGDDIVLNIGKGSITFKNADRSAPIVLEQDGGETLTYQPLEAGLTYDGKKVKLSASKNFSGVIDGYADTVKEITASSASSTVAIVGNDLDNMIKASKGGSTLDGGAGNDVLVGGAGADRFVYSSGNDMIKSYAAVQGDVIKLEATPTGSSVKGSDVILKFGDEALTIKGGLNKELQIEDANNESASYLFTGAAVYKLQQVGDDLNEASSSAQLAANDYWFELTDVGTDPLNEILKIGDAAIEYIERGEIAQSIEPRGSGIASSGGEVDRRWACFGRRQDGARAWNEG